MSSFMIQQTCGTKYLPLNFWVIHLDDIQIYCAEHNELRGEDDVYTICRFPDRNSKVNAIDNILVNGGHLGSG